MGNDSDVLVSTYYNCEKRDDFEAMIYNPVWRHNMIGCILIQILKEMYELNVTYVHEAPNLPNNTSNPDVDLFALPFALSSHNMHVVYPIQAVVHGRFGFIVRRPHDLKFFNQYYFRPFTATLWKFLTLVAVVVCFLFFLGAWWEKKLVGGTTECSLGLEMLLIIGGYCQHIFPVEVIFCSRRTAYFTFFMYSYIIYTVYTSNLLSHLVSDKDVDFGLNYLATEGFEVALLQNMKHILADDYRQYSDSAIYKKLSYAEAIPVSEALDSIRYNRTAVLSDYMTLYPFVHAEFSGEEICDLIEVDLNSDVRKYMFASTRFLYREELKIGILRAKEAGIVKKLTYYDDYHPLKCETMQHQDVKLEHIFVPLIILVVTYVISLLIMLLEKLHYQYTKVWPYVN